MNAHNKITPLNSATHPEGFARTFAARWLAYAADLRDDREAWEICMKAARRNTARLQTVGAGR